MRERESRKPFAKKEETENEEEGEGRVRYGCDDCFAVAATYQPIVVLASHTSVVQYMHLDSVCHQFIFGLVRRSVNPTV